MAKYTSVDIDNAHKFAQTNTNIRLLYALHKKVPHIASWLTYEIRDATFDDYYIPATLKHACKHIDINITENLCSLISCTAMKETRPCDPKELASYYYVGDKDYDVQCQPACFHTLPKPTYTSDGTRKPDIETLQYNKIEKKCRIVNSPVTTFLEKPFYRSSTIYEVRVNDMPTGFTRIPSTNRYGCGITYKNNEQYCKYFDRTMKTDGSCDLEWWEQGIGIVFSMVLVNSIKSGIRMLTNDKKPFAMPTNLPKLPETLAPIHTLEGWRKNINEDFVLPELINTLPQRITPDDIHEHSKDARYHENDDISNNIHIRRSAEINDKHLSNFARYHMGLEQNNVFDDDVDDDHHKHDDNNVDGNGVNDNNNDDDMSKKKSRTRRSVKIPNIDLGEDAGGGDDDGIAFDPIDKARKGTHANNFSDDKTRKTSFSKTILLRIKMTLIRFIQSFTEPKTYGIILANVGFNIFIESLKPLVLRLAEKLTNLLTVSLFQSITRVTESAFGAGLRTLIITVVSRSVFNIASKVAIFMAKLIGAAVSVYGWLTIGMLIFDLVFTIWDPFGYLNMYPASMASDIMSSGEIALREAIEQASANFEFQHLVAKNLEEDEVVKIQLDSLFDTILYLESLVVNSEGSRIDKGEELDFSQIDAADLLTTKNEAIATRVKFNNYTFYQYNEKFMTRVQINRYIMYVSGISLAISAVLFLLRLNILGMVFLILFVIIIALSRLSLQNDLLVDLLYKYRNRNNPYDSDIGYMPD